MSQAVIDLTKLKDFDNKAALDFLGNMLFSFNPNNPLTAHANGGQTSAVLLTANTINIIGTVTTGADSVKLPVATRAGQWVIVCNEAAANSMQVFGSGTDTINLVTSVTGVAQAAGVTNIYIAKTATGTADDWIRI